MFEENNNDFNIYEEQPEGNSTQEIPFVEPIDPFEPIDPYGFIVEEHRQKADIRRIALIVGIPTLCLSAIGYLWQWAYKFITMNVLGMSRAQAAELLQNPAMRQILQIVLSCFMFLVPFAVAAKCARIKIDDMVQFGRAKKGTFLPFVFFGLGFCAFANVATSYVSSFFEQFIGEQYNVPDIPDAKGFYGFLLSFISTAIVPAMVEEFACRGIVLGLLKKYGEGFAIVTSSLIFGIMHGNFDQIPFATVVGLILGYIYVKTESIWPCILVHGINNAISVIFSYMPSSISADIQNIIYIIYLIFCMGAAIFGILSLNKKGNEDFSLKKEEFAVSEKQKYITFFTSWVIILFVATNLYEAMSYFEF